MSLLAEARGALDVGTAWRAGGERVAGLAWLPLAGALVGALAALVTGALERVAPPLAAAGGVAVLRGLAPRGSTAAGLVTAALELVAVALLPAGARALPLVLAAGLSRWAVVVQCYGGAPARGAAASSTIGRARFREFGWASLAGIGGALVAMDALGLLAVLTTAAATLGLRVRAYRRRGGLGEADLLRTERVVEAAVLAVLAAVARALGSGR